jgi:RNA polymerase sigma factor FliA
MRAGIKRYRETVRIDSGFKDERHRQALVLEYAPLVKTVAERVAMRLPSHLSKDELISAGIIGLFDALDKFDATKGTQFRTYAARRIKGAIIDELRKMDWVSRSVRKNINRIEKAMIDIRNRYGREPEDIEVAKALDVDIETYYKMIDRAKGAGLLSLDEILLDGKTTKIAMHASELSSPFDELKTKELKNVIAKAISTLPEKEQLVISLYYFEELTLKEIAGVLDLTESRISQIHSKVILKLRSRLRAFFEEQ